MFQVHPNCLDGYNLFHEGILAFADFEERGLNIDIDYCLRKDRHIKRRISKLQQKIKSSDEGRIWRKKYGKKTNYESSPQLGYVLFDHLKYKTEVKTAKGKQSTSTAALEQIDLPFVKDVQLLKKLRKMSSTYFGNFMRETVEGVLHCFYNLHTVRSFRSSSTRINFQNLPSRIPELEKMIRSAIVPRPDHLLGEVDYSGVEVRIAACYHKDPNMIDDIINPEKDMHRDMAMECYLLGIDQWTKQTRYCGKNMFVFPQFYGSYYAQCAKNLWDAMSINHLTTKQGMPLKSHLEEQKIWTYNDFERHIESVEDYFWNERYPIYHKWREAHWKDYQKKGYVDILTGFRCSGWMKKNKVINYPVQGAAFHCLLWSAIRINQWLKENNFDTYIIGQIHDSIVFDFNPKEINVVMKKVLEIMTEEIIKEFPWIIVPLEVEVEFSPLNGSWSMKKEVKMSDFECDCDNHWFYEMEDPEDKSLFIQCPVCQSEYEYA